MKITGIEHIGIAVDDLKKDGEFWRNVLGIRYLFTEDIDKQGVVTDIYDTGSGKIELLKSKNPNSPIAKFLKKRGKGIHHICLKVDNINQAIIELKKNKVKLIGDNITIGAEGFRVIFIHPKSTGGVLLELAEEKY